MHGNNCGYIGPDSEIGGGPTEIPDKLQRRAAGRQGLVLSKNRRKHPRAVRFGLWFLHTAARMNGKPGRLLTDCQGITVDTGRGVPQYTERQDPQ